MAEGELDIVNTFRGEISNVTRNIISDYFRTTDRNQPSYSRPSQTIPLEHLAGDVPEDISASLSQDVYFDTNGITISCRSRHLKVASNPLYDQPLFRFDLDDQGRTKGIVFAYDINPAVVRSVFAQLTEVPFFQKVKQAYSIEDTSPTDQEIYEKAIVESKKIEEEAKEIRQKARRIEKSRKALNVENDKVVIQILQGEYAISSPQRRYLETIGAGPCIIVSLYDADQHKAALTHIDTQTDVIKTLTSIRAQMKNPNSKGNPQHLVTRIFGGTENSMQLLVGTKREISSWGIDAEIVEWDVLNSQKSIILDSHTGEVFDVLRPRQRVDTLEIQARSMGRQAKTMMGKAPADQVIK